MHETKLLTKYFKKFYLKIFIFFRRCRWHRWQTFIREYLREFSKKFEMIPIRYSEARGTLIYEKNLKSKISCQTPFNVSRNLSKSWCMFSSRLLKKYIFTLFILCTLTFYILWYIFLNNLEFSTNFLKYCGYSTLEYPFVWAPVVSSYRNLFWFKNLVRKTTSTSLPLNMLISTTTRHSLD